MTREKCSRCCNHMFPPARTASVFEKLRGFDFEAVLLKTFLVGYKRFGLDLEMSTS